MRINLMIALVLTFFSLTAVAQEKPRRFIFLVHGINGNKNTFGSLDKILEEHGKLIQPEHEINVIPITYTTGANYLSTYEFADALGDVIVSNISGGLKPTDTITFVSHSQGGLISWIFSGRRKKLLIYFEMLWRLS